MNNYERFEAELKAECQEKCSDIFNKSIAEPKEWIWDSAVEVDEEGVYLRVTTCYGGPTEWWTLNEETQSGRYYYRYGNVLCHKDFGKAIYQMLMEARG